MSMLSAQCDELRSMAVSVGLDMPQAATLMMGAADAIEGLESENAKLRELVARAYKTARMMCEAWDGPCQSNSDVPSWRVPCPTDERDEQCVFGQLERDLRELEIEVTA